MSNIVNFAAGEKNPWYVALKSYRKCVETFLVNNIEPKELREQLSDPNVDRICSRELAKLREIAPTIAYKEVIGFNEDETYYRNPPQSKNI
jgi:hypothetical protein